MGLDMYLNKRTYIGNHYKQPADQVKVDVAKAKNFMGEDINIKQERVSEIVEQVGYWRKANQIHKWFVDNVMGGDDRCQDFDVSTEQLQDLLNLVNKVLKASVLVKGKIQNGSKYENGKMIPIMEDGKYIKNPATAKKLLPNEGGFFFGSLDYDEYYYNDLVETKKILETVIKEGGDYSYRPSW